MSPNVMTMTLPLVARSFSSSSPPQTLQSYVVLFLTNPKMVFISPLYTWGRLGLSIPIVGNGRLSLSSSSKLFSQPCQYRSLSRGIPVGTVGMLRNSSPSESKPFLFCLQSRNSIRSSFGVLQNGIGGDSPREIK